MTLDNREVRLRNRLRDADKAFFAVSMREGVTLMEVEEARRVRETANAKACEAYRHWN